MKRLYRVLWRLAFIHVLCTEARPQAIFSAAYLPSHPGQSYHAYHSTNVNLSGLLGQTNGPQRWDFSLAQPNETIRRVDIVPLTNTLDATKVPCAAYAERDTDESGKQVAWRYYALTNSGRRYFGFHNNGNNLIVFDQPTLDVPATVQFGQTWARSVTWTEVISYTIPVVYQFTADAKADAYGTMVLPDIGEVPALRVKEVHHYEASEDLYGLAVPILSQTNQLYYWLTPGLGMPVQILLFGNNALFPMSLAHTNEVLRQYSPSPG